MFSPVENMQCLRSFNLQTGHYTLPETEKVGQHEKMDNAEGLFPEIVKTLQGHKRKTLGD